MQQFTVPQFIDVEDKIIGPITARQFIIMLAGFLLMGVFYKIFDFSLFVAASALIIVVTGVFAFIKINGRPFHFFVLNLVQTFKKPKLRTWNNSIDRIIGAEGEEIKSLAASYAPPRKIYTTSRLAELSLIVDTRGAYKEEKNEQANIKSV